MDRYSRGRIPKGFPLEKVDSKARIGKNGIYPHNLRIAGHVPTRRKVSRASGVYMISRAYSEPSGHNLVEQILLGRDYIID